MKIDLKEITIKKLTDGFVNNDEMMLYSTQESGPLDRRPALAIGRYTYA